MNKKFNLVKTMGFSVFSDNLEKIDIKKKQIINTISPNSYGISTKDLTFKNALIDSDILVLDGVYFGLGYFLKTFRIIKKNQGPELTNFLLEKANKNNLKVFFMGSTVDTLKKIKKRLNTDFPNINIAYHSPPYKDIFTEKDNQNILNSINKFKPDFLFVGLTCPKQEKWSFRFRESIDATIICNIGAVFEWISGDQKRIHPLWWRFRLGWLKRTIDRPEILKRYPNIGIYFRDVFFAILCLNNIKLND